MWRDQLEAMSDEDLRDLLGYLNGDAKYEHADRVTMVQALLNGKKRSVFYLMDKDAFKTLRRLVRHPDRPLAYRYYPVKQLLELAMIEAIPHLDHDDEGGWYQIREEAMPFALRVAHNRHYEPLVNEMRLFDQLMMGLMHSYGVLELGQCTRLLAHYGLDFQADRLFAAISWRLSIREQLQAFQMRSATRVTSFIMLRGMDFMDLHRHIQKYRDLPYRCLPKDALLMRKERYFALANEEMKQLSEALLKRFSRKLVQRILYDLIEAKQYHRGPFSYEDVIYRVFEKEAIIAYLQAASASIPDLYRKGYSEQEWAAFMQEETEVIREGETL